MGEGREANLKYLLLLFTRNNHLHHAGRSKEPNPLRVSVEGQARGTAVESGRKSICVCVQRAGFRRVLSLCPFFF